MPNCGRHVFRARCRGTQLLKEVRHAHTELVRDVTGVGREATAYIAEHLTDVIKESSIRTVLRTQQGRTLVGWKPRSPKKDDSELRPWHLYPSSTRVGRLANTVSLRRVAGDGAPAWRATCNGWNCQRFLAPCSCLATVYPGPFRGAGDLHPATLASTAAGALDHDWTSTTYKGLLVEASRKDVFGMTPAQREASAVDLVEVQRRVAGPALLDAGVEDSGPLPCELADVHDDDVGLEGGEGEYTRDADGAGTGVVTFGELKSAFAACTNLAADSPRLTQHVLCRMRDLAEELQDMAAGENVAVNQSNVSGSKIH